jgi:hypothetical protein
MLKLILCVCLLSLAMVMPSSSEERQLNYWPEDNAFVCVNGSNRYTRALYGGFTEWRLETSDRPVFATYKKGAFRNVRVIADIGGVRVPLDSTDYCKACYTEGRRDYVVKDKRLNGGTITLSVAADREQEGAVWQISADTDLNIEVIISNTNRSRFSRYGDIGTGGVPEGLDAKRGERPLQTYAIKLKAGVASYFAIDEKALSLDSQQTLRRRYAEATAWCRRLSSTVSFTTPDPFINPIGGAMVMAADGAWDGKVWNHGAVGWRMPLPGWRGAFCGDFLGMFDRQLSHFNGYAKSQVTDVPVTLPHLMDSANNLARGAYQWGTPMYSNGYICRLPEDNHKFHHYDMNLNFIDELLWHFEFDADTSYMRRMWPVLKRHLAWEKQAWDPDNDGLYDAYCCIWASDALQYNSGAVTHSSAYNYRGNCLAARIAEIIGEDPTPYRAEAEKIRAAMDARLWLPRSLARRGPEGRLIPPHWAEYQDFMGLKRIHPDAALWSVYVPIDCGVGTPEKDYDATRYVDQCIPHIKFRVGKTSYYTLSTSDWQPYEWSINNVAMAEVMHTALAYWQAGRANEAYDLLKGCVMDFMYTGLSPANFGQISRFDVNKGEAYRDFTDATGIASRAFIEGLYGITPDALNGRCIIRPGFPSSWDSASVHTPYLDYSFRRVGGKEIYHIRQHFKRPLQIVIRQNTGGGAYVDTVLTADTLLTIAVPSRREAIEGNARSFNGNRDETVSYKQIGTALDDVVTPDCKPIVLSEYYNANVSDIFQQNKYLSPRSPYTTLALPTQGIGDWCSTKRMAVIDDAWLRRNPSILLRNIPFTVPSKGFNVIYTSLWDNYPDSVTVPLKGRGSHVYLLMTGSTNPMQSHIENGYVSVRYKDGSSEKLSLVNPDNWCPIEQDYEDNGLAFRLPSPRPYRVSLKTGKISRTLAQELGTLTIDGGAAQLLEIKIDPAKKLRDLIVRTTANDVVIGLIAVTVQKTKSLSVKN